MSAIVNALELFKARSGHSVVWINLREEPVSCISTNSPTHATDALLVIAQVVYVKNEPYLLRDYSHPFRCMEEFETGMTHTRSEQVRSVGIDLQPSRPPDFCSLHA